MKLREIRVSGETDDEYTKGAKVGGTTTTNTTNTTNEGGTIAAQQTRRIQQLEAALIEAEAAAGQVCVLTLFKIIHLIPLMVCFHCPIPVPRPTPMQMAIIVICRTVSTEPRPIPIPIPMVTVPILAPI